MFDLSAKGLKQGYKLVKQLLSFLEVQSKTMTRSETFPGPARVRRASDSEPEPDWVTPPPKQQSIGDALASALACASIEGSGSSSGSSGKKKGKKAKGFKKLDLFPSARPTL